MHSRIVKKTTKTSLKRLIAWSHIPKPPKDPILSLNAEFKQDPSSKKVNLTIGAYRDESGDPWILPSVKLAVDLVNKNLKQIEYLPPRGDQEFLDHAWKIAYGEHSEYWKNGHIGGSQVLSGTGGLYTGLRFAEDWWLGNRSQIYVTNPTWPVHISMASWLGYNVVQMPYFDEKTNSLDFKGYTESMLKAPEKSIFLLHPCAHNPTGIDPSKEQWKIIREIFEEKGHLAFFDMAYQGFASGNLDKDALAIRLWQERRLPFLLGQSFAKSMGLYGTRTGAFSVPCDDLEQKEIIDTECRDYVCHTYLFPPLYGASIAKTLMGDERLFKLWNDDLGVMSGRIMGMRWALREALEKRGRFFF